MDIVDYNKKAWDGQATSGECRWSQPVSKEEIANAKDGNFEIFLTPNTPVPMSWFPESLSDSDVLCLASGGGQQVPILAATGAQVTSFDNSPEQLELDRQVCERENLEIRLEQGDAADLSRFEDESFDFVWHPCSNSFMPNIEPVWKECFRVLRSGGSLVSGFLNPMIYMFDRLKDENEGILEVRYSLPFSDIKDLPKEELDEFIKDGEPLEYSHTLEQQIGGQISAGFQITGFFEDYWSDEATTLNKFSPTSIATKATKP